MSSPDSRLITSMASAVAAAPDDPVLRLHLGELLVDSGDSQTAIPHLATALQQDPGSERARALMARALGTGPRSAPTADPEVSGARPAPATAPPPPSAERSGRSGTSQDDGAPLRPDDYEFTSSRVTLADVAGMRSVKDRLEAAFLAPMRNAELRRAFGKSLRGGLLLYGPPGCGKTFLARGVAGEMGADFLTVSLADVLDRYIGNSERNIQALFQRAREYSPCVVFLDELDAIGGRRNKVGPYLRNVVTQLLTELDSVAEDNEGVFLLAATNHPWDVDPALRRPGRLDRMLFVPPPDGTARAAILTSGLRDRPTEGLNVTTLARRTEGLSGADLSHLGESAAERALLDSSRLGRVRPIGMPDFEHALAEVRASTGDWFEGARAAVAFANKDNSYQELADYLHGRGGFWR
ncbi:AAA family ATPase [Nocardiopsis quinghaiensis]|uniref:AAA family ATPase n=1 Tax=Nocardiopsis quinghaiensis TaxID=464995 RepID=UPI00168062D0|nr:AAA family ATPase [Nocardiopsis quinghaiensis]